MKKQNIAIIAVVAFVLAVAVGYALFSETITINGTATAKGNFDVEVVSAEVIGGEGYVEDDSVTYATRSDNNNQADLFAELQYPGAYVNYKVIVENKGSIEAVLKAVNEETKTDPAKPVYVKYTSLPTETSSLKTGQQHEILLTVFWEDDDALDEEDGATYSLTFDYEQVTVKNPVQD